MSNMVLAETYGLPGVPLQDLGTCFVCLIAVVSKYVSLRPAGTSYSVSPFFQGWLIRMEWVDGCEICLVAGNLGFA